jgi:hypothetical protein
MKGNIALFSWSFRRRFPAPAPADMYKWTDKAGVVHFSSARDPSAELLKEGDLAPMWTVKPRRVLSRKRPLPGAITVTGGLL